MLRKSSRSISRESSESAYSWDSKGVEKTEIVGIGDKVEYIECRIDVCYTPHGVLEVLPPACQRTAAVCEPCDLLVREPRCNLQSEKGRTSYGWRGGGLPDSVQVIRSEKTEGRKSYGVFGIGSAVSRLSNR